NPNIEQELVELEKQYWQALKDKDGATAAKLSDDPCVVAGADGVREMRRDEIQTMAESSAYSLNNYELDDVHVRVLDDDVAVVAYKVHEDVTIGGERLGYDATDSSTWVRRDGQWVCAMHAEA